MKKRLFTIALALIFCIIALAGCGAKSEDYYYAGTESYVYSEEVNSSNGTALNPEEKSTAVITDRKLIKNITISLDTRNFDEFNAAVTSALNGVGGYIESSNLENHSSDNRYVVYVLRVPADKTNEFEALLGEKGTVTSRNENVKDITATYVDNQSHLKALRAEEESLLELMKKADDLSDIIAVQDRLTQVRYEIESLEATLRTFDQQVAYSTLHLSVSEVDREATDIRDKNIWTEIGANLADGFYGVGMFFRDLFVFMISAIPFLLGLAVFAVPIIIFGVIRPLKKIKKKKQERENKE